MTLFSTNGRTGAGMVTVILISVYLMSLIIFAELVRKAERLYTINRFQKDMESCLVFNKPDAVCVGRFGDFYKCEQSKNTYQEAIDVCIEYAKHR